MSPSCTLQPPVCVIRFNTNSTQPSCLLHHALITAHRPSFNQTPTLTVQSFATAIQYQGAPRFRRASSSHPAFQPSPANPPSSSPLSSPPRPQPERLQAQLPQRTTSQNRQPTSSPIPQVGESRPKDFSFLLRPEIYHPLTPLNVPVAFRNSPKQPDPATPLEQLLARGHFRAAAIASVQELTGSGAHGAVDPADSQRIFTLLYTRLVCLTLIDATPLAAQEVKALEDLSNVRTYVDDKTGEHLVPWELRVLNVRLQALGFGDPRRAVMSYHDLAREAREHIGTAMEKHDNSSSELWKARLHELGVKVAGALIDMDDLSGAAHHLKSLKDKGDGKIALSKALLWLHIGDADKARDCAAQCSDNAAETEKLILALCEMADGDYESALTRWKDLREAMPDDEMVGVNTAVCLLYIGRMQEARMHPARIVEHSVLTVSGARYSRKPNRVGLLLAHPPV